MTAKPLKKAIYDKAKELGIEQITLHFSGGNDEGYLDVGIEPYEKYNQDLSSEIEEWAWDVYSYSGAGEGYDYGDNISYDLKSGKVSTSEWYTSRQEGDTENGELEIEEEEE